MEHNIEMTLAEDHKTLGKKDSTITVHHPLQAAALEEKGVAKFVDASDKKAATKAVEADEKKTATAAGVNTTTAVKS